ncbi:hypothetical protein QUA26_25960 [Microcoleus sp. Pol12A4]|uniref:hypothetical protein n=1 Tax=unclassified Microcoleus TaxID=2642155 RepID=UPI002FD74ABF
MSGVNKPIMGESVDLRFETSASNQPSRLAALRRLASTQPSRVESNDLRFTSQMNLEFEQESKTLGGRRCLSETYIRFWVGSKSH